MPNGKTHDAVTFLFVAPVFAAGWRLTENAAIATVVTVAFLFGGLMFGPDLDTVSKQYARWGILKFLWFPYQAIFAHRSRWSHGLVFGTLLRVLYFMLALSVVAFAVVYVYASYVGGDLPRFAEFTRVWLDIGEYIRRHIGEYFLPSLFIGLWLGAASHTLTDMAGTFVKTGRVTEFL
ncbi:MAG: metal-binding protein [Acidobacteria bacterium]|nr:metal-binding protein [Acidobacteriota bacterium]